MAKTYEVFTTKYSKIIQAITPGGAEDNFWQNEKNESIEIIAIIEVERGKEFISKPSNYAIFDFSKRYRFTIQDVDTNEILIIDEDTERKAFRKAIRFFDEKKLKDRELHIISKIDNITNYFT